MISEREITALLDSVQGAVATNSRREVYTFALSTLDLTTLSVCDTERSVGEFAQRAAKFYTDYPELEGVASLCVYPPFVECVGLVVDGTPLRITAVVGSFPSSQTFLEVKALEVAMALESGADEIDMVISVGKILEGEYDEATSELVVIREEASDAIFKVIIESGELGSSELIYRASMCAIEAGADFIKTSTGKSPISATPEAVVVMCQAIKDHYASTGERVGIKIAGGVRKCEDVVLYYTIVEQMLGREWLTPELLRIGASGVANELLSAIVGEETSYF